MYSNAIIPRAQFRAVILCGYGSDLFPLIEPPLHPCSPAESDEDDSPAVGTGSGGGMGEENDYTNDGTSDSEASGDEPVAGEGGKVQRGFKVRRGRSGEGKGDERRREVGQIKSLLPVAGRKMIDWVLDLVEEAGIYDILILTPASIAAPLSTHLRARRVASSIASGNLGVGVGVGSAKIDLEEVGDEIAGKRGTVGVLCWAFMKGFIKSDLIILPCDLLLSPSPTSKTSLASLIDTHRINDNLLTTLFQHRSAASYLPASKEGPAEILTVYDRESGTLCDIREMDEFDEEVPLRTSLLERFPKVTMSTGLLPTQVYVLSVEVLDLLREGKNERRLRHMESIRDLIGWISRLAWRKRGRNAVNYSPPSLLHVEDGLAGGRSTTQLPVGVANRLLPFARGEEMSSPHSLSLGGTPRKSSTPISPAAPTTTTKGRSEWDKANLAPSRQLSELNLHGLERSSTSLTAPGVRRATGGGTGGAGNGRGKCEIVIWTKEDGWCGRGNTVAGWIEMNRAAITLLPPPTTTPLTPSGVFISTDTFLHPSAYEHMGEKVGLKRCIVGKGCWIGKGSKLTGCLLMEGCRVGEGVKLDNCILSNGVSIGDRSVLKDCEFGRGVLVEIDSTLKGEQIILEDD